MVLVSLMGSKRYFIMKNKRENVNINKQAYFSTPSKQLLFLAQEYNTLIVKNGRTFRVCLMKKKKKSDNFFCLVAVEECKIYHLCIYQTAL